MRVDIEEFGKAERDATQEAGAGRNEASIPMKKREDSISPEDPKPRPSDRSCGGIKIPFALLSLWPPFGFWFLNDPGDGEQERKSQFHAAFWLSIIPLSLGLACAVLSLCGFCRHRLLGRLLFCSDVICSVGNFSAGVFIVVLHDDWEAACLDGSEYACALRGVAIRIVVDVFAMALIHLGSACWLYRSEVSNTREIQSE